MKIFVIAFWYYLEGIHKLYGWQVSRMINIAASSAKLGINIPELNWGFLDDVLDVAGSCPACSLVLYVDEMSITLNADNSVSRSPF